GLWRWISIGYRFVPVSWHSRLLGDAHRVIFGRSRRFLGVDVGDTLGLYTSFWQGRIRTVSWCLFLAPDFVTRLDPLPEPRQLRRSDVDVEPLGDAWRLGAGSSPLLGDLHRREDVSAYRALDRALRPVRASGGVNFLPPWDDETTAEWL